MSNLLKPVSTFSVKEPDQRRLRNISTVLNSDEFRSALVPEIPCFLPHRIHHTSENFPDLVRDKPGQDIRRNVNFTPRCLLPEFSPRDLSVLESLRNPLYVRPD